MRDTTNKLDFKCVYSRVPSPYQQAYGGDLGILNCVTYHSPSNAVLFYAKSCLSVWPFITYYRITLTTI